MSSSEIIVSGYPIGYRIIDSKLYLLGDDLGGYFGYSRSKYTGKCHAIYADSGIGLCKPKVYLEFAGSKRLFYPFSAVSRFVQLCTTDRDSVAKRFAMLKLRFSKLEISSPTKEEKITVVEKAKLVSLTIKGDAWIAKFESGEEKKVSPKESSSTVLTHCSITNKIIPPNKEHFLFEIKKKGYGLYRVLK